MENPKYTESEIGRCRSRKLDLRSSKEKGKILDKIWLCVWVYVQERKCNEGRGGAGIDLLGT